MNCRTIINGEVRLAVVIEVGCGQVDAVLRTRRERRKRRSRGRELTAAVVQQHNAIGSDNVLVPLAAQICGDQIGNRLCGRRDRERLRGIEGAIAAAGQHGDGLLARSVPGGDDRVQVAVAVHVRQYQRLGERVRYPIEGCGTDRAIGADEPDRDVAGQGTESDNVLRTIAVQVACRHRDDTRRSEVGIERLRGQGRGIRIRGEHFEIALSIVI